VCFLRRLFLKTISSWLWLRKLLRKQARCALVYIIFRRHGFYAVLVGKEALTHFTSMKIFAKFFLWVFAVSVFQSNQN
jgi:hypothetical protein